MQFRPVRKVAIAIQLLATTIIGMAVLYGRFWSRRLMSPVHRVSAMAHKLADGDLTVRVPESSTGAIGTLEHSFNELAGHLEHGRRELDRMGEVQAALRRVATLVAHGADPPVIYDAVTAEMSRVLAMDYTATLRFDTDGTMRLLAGWTGRGDPLVMPPVGSRWSLEGTSIASLVVGTRGPVRLESNEYTTADITAWDREHGIKGGAGCPIVVHQRLWGVLVALSTMETPLSATIETEMQDFADLVSTAIVNADSNAELAASRTRLVAAADAARRQIERHLHDATQQRLISLALDLRLIESSLGPDQTDLRTRLAADVEAATELVEELQEISRGLHPAISAKGGLGPAIRALTRRSSVPVRLDIVTDHRMPDVAEVSIYYVVSEGLANVAKYAKASLVTIELRIDPTGARLRLRDDGVGGARLDAGSGLTGLNDRLQAIGGTLEVISPPGRGTLLVADIPTRRADRSCPPTAW